MSAQAAPQTRASLSDNCGLTLGELADATDKLSLNLSFVKHHLSAIQTLLEGSETVAATDAEVLSYAADHFVKIVEHDLDSLFRNAKQKIEEAR